MRRKGEGGRDWEERGKDRGGRERLVREGEMGEGGGEKERDFSTAVVNVSNCLCSRVFEGGGNAERVCVGLPPRCILQPTTQSSWPRQTQLHLRYI